MYSVKQIDVELVYHEARYMGNFLYIEEHSSIGGLEGRLEVTRKYPGL